MEKRNSASKGFTLIELVVAIAVTAVLAVLVSSVVILTNTVKVKENNFSSALSEKSAVYDVFADFCYALDNEKYVFTVSDTEGESNALNVANKSDNTVLLTLSYSQAENTLSLNTDNGFETAEEYAGDYARIRELQEKVSTQSFSVIDSVKFSRVNEKLLSLTINYGSSSSEYMLYLKASSCPAL